MKKKILIITSRGLLKKSLLDFKKKYNNYTNIVFCNDILTEIEKHILDCNALINCPRNLFTKNLLSKSLGSLEWVHIGGAGCEEYLFPEFTGSKIILTNGKIIQGPEVSDHAIALLLSISRNLNYVFKNKITNMPRPIELRKKTALIVGMGGIGSLVAEKLSSFGMNIVGVDQNLVPLNSYVDEFIYSKNISKVINNADVVICALPYTLKNHHFFSSRLFNKMKKNVIFINISRGKVVDTSALIKFVRKDKFYGVGLDVTDPEPLSRDHSLRKNIKIIITPHIAGPSDYNRERSLEVLKTNLENFILKLPLINIVDKKLGF